MIKNITNFFRNIFAKKPIYNNVLPSEEYTIELRIDNYPTWTCKYNGKPCEFFFVKENAFEYCWNHHKIYASKEKSDFQLFREYQIIDADVV